MGSTNFEDYTTDTLDVAEAYRQLRNQALSEFGHDAYNGTISTTGGYRVVVPPDMALTIEEARKYGEQHLDGYSKWSECGAVAIREAEDEDPREIKVTIDLDNPKGDGWQDMERIRAAVDERVKLKAGESIRSVAIEQPQYSGYYPNQEVTGGPVHKVKGSTQATTGKTVTRYFIVASNARTIDLDWAKGHPSQAAARAVLDEHVKRPVGVHREQNEDWDIIAVTRRETGDPLVRGTRVITKTSYPVTVKIAKIVKGAHNGWYFFGMAAC